MIFMKRRLWPSLVLLSGLAGACSDSGSAPATVVVPTPAVVTQVIVDVDSTVMTVGSRGQATAQALDARGSVVPGKTPTWTSSNPAVVTVSSSGAVTALAAGGAKVIATIDGARGERDVVMRPLPAVQLVDVSLPSATLTVGDTVTATVLLLDAVGNTLRGRTIRWSITGDPTVATVSQTGRVTAIAPGSATLVAESDSARGSFDFAVVPPAPGNARVASVAVTLPSLTLTVGRTAQATATPLDSAGRALSPRPIAWSLVTGAGVVSVSTSGLVTAIAPGAAQLRATIDGVAGTAALTVRDSSTAPGGAVVLPTLPETLHFTFPQVRGRQWIVRAGDNLQGALNSAQRGDEIVLEAGASFQGNFSLPPKPGSLSDGWIIIRSDKLAQLPPRGTRVTPSHAALMPKIVTTNNNAALATLINANGWWMAGIEFTVAPSVTALVGRVVMLGVGSAPQTSLAVVPSDLVLDRVYIHPQPNQGVQRCLELHSARTAVEDSFLTECHAKGFDSQAIVGWNGPGPYRIVNNTLAGAGENVMFGGADPAIRDLIPSDIQLSRNHIYTPISWKGLWTKKNLVETKNVARFLIEGNVLEGSWADGQVGYAFLLKSANQSGRCTWCASRDITIRNNLVRNVGAGFYLPGREGGSPYPVGELLNRVLIENNIAEQVNVAPYLGDSRLVQVANNTQNVTIRSNTLTSSGSLAQFLSLASIPAATNIAFENNVVSYGTYGLFSSKYGVGEVSLQGFLGTIVFRGNVAIGAQKPGYPQLRFVPTLAAAEQLSVGADRARITAATLNVVIP
jgi:uncharacterized protein YjdB